MSKHHPSLVLGFHACEKVTGEEILAGKRGFKASKNSFDWLGSGMYFWENSPHRAHAYGQELKGKRNKLQDPIVIGAVISLGYSCDLLESHSLAILKAHYKALKDTYSAAGIEMPVNDNAYNTDIDKLFRIARLCCISIYAYRNKQKQPQGI